MGRHLREKFNKLEQMVQRATKLCHGFLPKHFYFLLNFILKTISIQDQMTSSKFKRKKMPENVFLDNKLSIGTSIFCHAQNL
jgi:hypothetical protein